MIEPQELTAIVESVGEFLLAQLESTQRELSEAKALIKSMGERLEVLEKEDPITFLEYIGTTEGKGFLAELYTAAPKPEPVDILGPIREEVSAEVIRALANIPLPENGKDADEDAIVRRLLKAIPTPQDGKPGEPGKDAPPVDMGQVRSIIAEEVAAIPKPKDGIDGKPGERGEPGKNADPVDTDAIVEAVVKRIPPPKDGEKGERGEAGASVHPDTVRLLVAEEVAKIPKAKDGEPGRSALEIEVLPNINPSKSYPPRTFAAHNGGTLMSKVKTSPGNDIDITEWLVVKDGVSAFEVLQGEDLRTFTFRSIATSGYVYVKSFVLPVVLYRGIYKSGTTYEAGDAVTYDNSTWICKEATSDVPGKSEKWQMSTRKGGNGKDGAPGAKGDAGPKGKDGQDLRYK